MGIKIAHVTEGFALFNNCARDFWIVVTENVGGYPAQKIKIFLALHIPDFNALASS